MGGDSPAVILFDSYGNPVEVVQDADGYRLLTQVKTQDSSGTVIDPATEGTLTTRASESTLATRASESTLVTRASEETLDEVAQSLADIRDSYGVKQIVDPLPEGSNLIGRVKFRSPDGYVDLGDADNPVRIDPTGTTTQPVAIKDGYGHLVGVIYEGEVYRLQTQATLVHQTTGRSPVKIEAEETSNEQAPFVTIGGYSGTHNTLLPSMAHAIQMKDLGQFSEMMVADQAGRHVLEGILRELIHIRNILEGISQE